eukprot:6286086-Amphidinium_carterae.2
MSTLLSRQNNLELFGGVGTDLDELISLHKDFLYHLLLANQYPKQTLLENALQAFFTALGGSWTDAKPWVLKQQAYQIIQLVSKLRKMAHNVKNMTRSKQLQVKRKECRSLADLPLASVRLLPSSKYYAKFAKSKRVRRLWQA